MLERFGYYQEGDRFRVEFPRALNQVVRELNQYFGFQVHDAVVQFVGPGGTGAKLRDILEQRGHSEEIIAETVKRANEGAETGGSTLYTGDLDLSIRPKPDYMCFFSTQTGNLSFLFALGEEITHGEHLAYIIENYARSYSDYHARFNTITEEFLGYMGRKRILQVSGVTREMSMNITWNRDMNANEWEHFIAYWVADDLLKKKNLPARELFHAPDQARFWKILLNAIGEPAKLRFNFPPSLKFEGLISPLNELLTRANADKAIQLELSYQE